MAQFTQFARQAACHFKNFVAFSVLVAKMAEIST
jgi:hypothetical protein